MRKPKKVAVMRKPKKVAAKKAKRPSAARRSRKPTRTVAEALADSGVRSERDRPAPATVTEARIGAEKAEPNKTPLVQITIKAARQLVDDVERMNRQKEIADARLVMFDQCFAMFANHPHGTPQTGVDNYRGRPAPLNELRYAIAMTESPPPPLPNSYDEPATF